MYNVFVVEDESLIRQSIRTMVENMSGPFAFCGEASDGEMALSMMQDMMPDILLTDIRMPFLDGFELIRHLKAMMPWLKIIIISGFGDFEYAQKAISLGVDLYLLKPVRAAELTKAIEQMAEKIEEERKSGVGSYDQDEVHTALLQRFMQKLLHGRMEVSELLEQARKLGVDIAHPYYQAVLFSFDSENQDHARLGRMVPTITRQSGIELACFNDPNRVTVIFCGNDPDQINEEIYRFNGILRHQLREVCPVITTVIGTAVRRPSLISESYRTASGFMQKAGALSVGKVHDITDSAHVLAEIVGFDNPFGDELQQKLQYIAVEEVHDMVAELLSGPAGDQYNSVLMRYHALLDVLRLCVRVITRVTPGADSREISAELGKKYDIFMASQTRESFCATVEALLTQVVSLRQENVGDMRYAGVISRAEKYIEQNYCDPNISLISTAKNAAMSPAHFSTIFSQTTGKSFIAYLTAKRMDKAKQLLSQTDKKLSEIAMDIGYNEPNYFSHVFRKTFGITPKEYRNLNRKD